MKRTAMLAAAVTLAAIPAAALAGGSEQGKTLECGTVTVQKAKPKLGLKKAGPYQVDSFAKAKGQAPVPCAKVKLWARRYVATGKVPTGYRAVGYSNMIGRNFYKGAGTGFGFQVIWTNG